MADTGDPAGPAEGIARSTLAILAADVVGYSRLAEIAEEDTHTRLRALRVRTIDPCVVSFRGRIVKNTGDGLIASFDSPLDAVACAIQLQDEVAATERAQPGERRIRFRIGVNVASTIVDSGDVFGRGVNIAARLQEMAPPGGIIISKPVFDAVAPRARIKAVDLGPTHLKNMATPVRAYSVLGHQPDTDPAARPLRRLKAKVPSIAVLPFRTEGREAGSDYIGMGLANDLIVALQSVRGLLVISRSSTLPYQGRGVDRRRVSRELGVRYVLSGSVAVNGARLRINASLADQETGVVIWADRYDGSTADIFALQSRIATRILWSIAPHVREAELKRALRKRSENRNAYELVLQAVDAMYLMRSPEFPKARELLQDAMRADETYATSFAYAALWHIHNVAQGWAADVGSEAEEATRLAVAAIERDPADGFALAVYGHTKALFFREYANAMLIFERALEASPGNAMAWTLSSGVYGYVGQGEAAVTRAEQGLRISPVDVQSYFYLMFLGQAHYLSRNYEEALIWAQKTFLLNPRLCANLRILAATLVALERIPEANLAARAILSVQPAFRLRAYAARCPFSGILLEEFIDRLERAGLPHA
ncbi:Tetratricopeptide TPR_2 repeat protein [Methylobacterium sp. 4-46]|uniref:adenylate/guanylate cyclase domain-containing protein n=1 Tax=unclassified Methylobacterium TaxID=2615210 RepID=UPI000165C818|nr:MULTISPECIES: adenylate/guanylate cyclase domain-containing protein [Methylobacterium]ACA15662.1 Tetratricopeptide TPR_2 repeat protein [Methylobacterium sp. 4-46]WFT81374.1 adenylate/guanylate cyclase domain-containing protein [Methylobacterium nodulans]